MIERMSRRDTMMKHAIIASGRSTCQRLQVGCVIVREHRIISTGYNGAPSGFPHCNHADDLPCTAVVHAEANGLVFAARVGASVEGCEMYVTHQPCASCAMLIINAGISTVTYARPYRDPTGLRLLQQGRVDVRQSSLTWEVLPA